MIGPARTSSWFTGLAAVTLALSAWTAPVARAQLDIDAPVYVNDAPVAEQAVERAVELASLGNHREAAAVLRDVLLSDRGAMTAAEAGDIYIPLRRHVHEVLLDRPELLKAYRELAGPSAAALLAEDRVEAAERDFLLTPAGFDAALRRAQRLLEEARFAGAALLLEQLDGHPDREGDGARRAAELLTRVSRYVGRDDAGEVVDASLVARLDERVARWRSEAGLAPAEAAAVERPPRPVTVDPFMDPGPVDLDGISRRPLSWAPVGRNPSPSERIRRVAAEADDARQRALFMAPVLVGDLVVVNDTAAVSAWNRFTLSRRWRVEIDSWQGAGPRGRGRFNAEELAVVAASEGVVLALSERSGQGGGGAERVVVALDATTGKPLWRTTLWELDRPELDGAFITGRPVVSQQTVTLTAVRQVPAERLVSVLMLGLDLATGELRWLTPVASSGSQNWGMRRGRADGAAASAGLVVFTDQIGVAGAIEAATGRFRWLRRIDEPGDSFRSSVGFPWDANVPAVRGDLAYTLTPARSWLAAVDRWTGDVAKRRRASAFGAPAYLLVAGDRLVGVGASGVVAQPIDDFGETDRSIRTLLSFNGADNEPLGRTIVVGDRLVSPLTTGAAVIDFAAADGDWGKLERIALERPGNLVAIDGQLLVIDDSRVQSYAAWRVARDELRAEMEARPDDPSPAVTFARLAHHAGKYEAIVPAVDAAIAAIEADPLATALGRARRELFVTLLNMIEPWRAGLLQSEVGEDETARVDERGRLGDAPLREALLRRLGAVAASPPERVAWLMAWGEHLDAVGRHAEAAERYQRVLADERLAAATYLVERSRSAGAALEATRRLRELVSRHGPAVYADFEREAKRRLDEALSRGDAGPETYLDIARRYPLARAAGVASTAAALRFAEQRRFGRAVYALEEAVATAERAAAEVEPRRGGGDPGDEEELDAAADEPAVASPPTFAERVRGLYAGGPNGLRAELASVLAASGRFDEARRVAEVLAAAEADVRVEVDGEALTPEQAGDRLLRLASEIDGRPMIGDRLGEAVAVSDWLVEPLAIGRLEGAPTDLVVMSSAEGDLGVFGATEQGLEPLWRERVIEAPLGFDRERLYTSSAFGSLVRSNYGVVARRLRDGEELWRSPGIDDVFDHADAPGAAQRVDLPLRRRVPLDEIDVHIGARVVVMIDRAGRAVGLDRDSGVVLWRNDDLVDVVHDSALARGVLIVGGGDLLEGQRFDRNHMPEERDHRLRAVEASTGRVLREWRPGSAISWLDPGPSGQVVVGTVEDVRAYDVERGSLDWSVDAARLRATLGGGHVGETLLVRTDEQELFALDAGRRQKPSITTVPLDGLMDRGFFTLRVQPLRPHFAVSTGYGVAVIDETMRPLGIDDRSESDALLPAAFAREQFVTIQREGDWSAGGEFGSFTLRLHRLPTALLTDAAEVQLRSPVSTIGLVDGWVLISSMRDTVAIRSVAGGAADEAGAAADEADAGDEAAAAAAGAGRRGEP